MFGDLQRSRIVAYSAAFVALITMGSWVSIPFFPVPITLQTLFVLLSGAVMKRYAVIPVSLYILFGAIGLPVFHNGIAGIGVLLGPTGGYLLGFLPVALIVGLV
ncbi:MAG: biotin transporter BioY, partial [Methanoregula sp.]|nr:biotin transporter BioY [Methanoregula sp.]